MDEAPQALRAEPIDPGEDPRYAEYVARHPGASIYHDPLWNVLLRRTFPRLESSYLLLTDGSGRTRGVLPGCISHTLRSPRAFVSLPLATYADPLLDEGLDRRDVAGILLGMMKDDRWKSVELHWCAAPAGTDLPSLNRSDQYVTHILPLGADADALWNGFHKTTIRQRIRQAERSGLTVDVSPDPGDVSSLHHLHTLSRRAIGLPPLPRAFFASLADLFLPSGHLTVMKVRAGGRVISVLLLLKHGRRAYAEYTATHPHALRHHPNHFILWRAIQLACAEGYEEFDFGRTSVENQGLLDFKKRWGARQEQLHYYYTEGASSTSAEDRAGLKFRAIHAVCRVLPAPALKRVGELFYGYVY